MATFLGQSLGWYLTHMTSYSSIYGAFATVPIFLIWLYLGWVIVLLGAVIAAYAPSLQSRVKRWPDAPGSRLLLALAVLRELERTHRAGAHGLGMGDLSEALQIDPLQTEPILEALMAFDWIGRLDEGADPRFVLICDPANTPAQPLLAAMLLEPSALSRGLWQRAGFDTLTLRGLIDD